MGNQATGIHYRTSALLRLVRLFDKTAYICLGCGRLKRGFAARFGNMGWVCCQECWDDALSEVTT